MKCINCETEYEMLLEVLAFKCSVCNKTNCLNCKIIHELECDVKTSIIPAQIQKPSGSLATLRNCNNSSVSLPEGVEKNYLQIQEKENNKLRKRASLISLEERPKPNPNPPKRRQTVDNTVERLFCEACNELYTENYIKIHLGTKKHMKNYRKMKAAQRV